MQTEIRTIIIASLLLIFSFSTEAQSFIFGVKGGPVIATQNWSNFQRNPLLDGHGIVFIETWAEGDPNVLFAQLGYHTRGSSLRQIFVNQNLGFNPQTRSFRFRNLALTIGAKRRHLFTDRYNVFYSVGIRGEYNISTNLDEFVASNISAPTTYPLNQFVVPFTYGIYGGGGAEFEISDLIGAVVELSVNPDLSRQYFQPPLNNVINPVNGMIVSLREKEIRNISIEISFGFRFLRKVVYID